MIMVKKWLSVLIAQTIIMLKEIIVNYVIVLAVNVSHQMMELVLYVLTDIVLMKIQNIALFVMKNNLNMLIKIQINV